MNFEKIDKAHLKVELHGHDLDGLEINYDSFNYESNHSRTIIKAILHKAYEETGFLYADCKLLIEVFKTKNGCIILFSKKPKTRRLRLVSKRMDIYKFNSIDELIDCYKGLKDKDLLENCRIYLLKNYYFICFKSKPEPLTLLYIKEFSSVCAIRNEAFLKEYGKLINFYQSVKK